MLAVRKLLLADDSQTIQKIVALTFADAGIEVIAVSDGNEAIEQLRENTPDVVLADVFMPGFTGYEVCEHIKKTDHLKHIPVMLLVGSFEPFDEAEARRVGADDTLSKPFKSIRNLMDRVGALLGREPDAQEPPAAENENMSAGVASPIDDAPQAFAEPAPVVKEATTRELPPPEIVQPPEDPMTSEELEVTTADTQPLSAENREKLQESTSFKAEEPVLETTPHPMREESTVEASGGFEEALLDLDQYEVVSFSETEDVLLDVDFDAVPQSYSEPDVAESSNENSAYAYSYSAPVTNSNFEPVAASVAVEEEARVTEPEEAVEVAPEAAAHFVDTEIASGVERAPQTQPLETPKAVSGQVSLENLSPEVIDAIARRVVEQMSAKAVQEIAWEVVPQLADLMIKKKLEEHETQRQ